MNKKKIVYQTNETIYGYEVRSKICYKYKADNEPPRSKLRGIKTKFFKWNRCKQRGINPPEIKIDKSNKTPVIVTLKFQDQHDFIEIPKVKIIKAETISKAFSKIIRYLRSYGMELKT